MKALKWILWIGGGLALLAIVAVAIVAATFDANQYKPQIVDLVKQRTGRTLTMDGRIGLTFFPKIGAEVAKVALSEPQGTKTFARIDAARVAPEDQLINRRGASRSRCGRCSRSR